MKETSIAIIALVVLAIVLTMFGPTFDVFSCVVVISVAVCYLAA